MGTCLAVKPHMLKKTLQCFNVEYANALFFVLCFCFCQTVAKDEPLSGRETLKVKFVVYLQMKKNLSQCFLTTKMDCFTYPSVREPTENIGKI